MKKLVQLKITCAILILLCGGSGSSLWAAISGDWEYEVYRSISYLSNNTYISTNGARIVRYLGTNRSVTIPDTLGGQAVISIGQDTLWTGRGVFSSSLYITNVTFSTNILEISYHAFLGATALTNVSLPSRAYIISSQAFVDCYSLRNINLAEVQVIGEEAFSNCTNLSNISLTSVRNLGNRAFNNCTGLINISIGNQMIYRGNDVFAGCTNVSAVSFAQGVRSVGGLNNLPNLSSVSLPSSVNTIEPDAFSGSGVRSISLPSNITAIGVSAFKDCRNLSSLTIPAGVTEIARETFARSGLSSIALPSKLARVGDSAFLGCGNLLAITIPNTLTNLGNNTFESCTNLINVALSTGLHSLGNGTFFNCTKLRDLIIPDRVSSVGSGAFQNCGALTNVVLSKNTFSLGARAFANCTNLPSVSIPDSVAVLEDQVFQNCSRLTSVFLPDSVTRIGNLVFEGCSRLASINVDPENLMFSSENGVLYNQIQVSLLQYPQARQGSSFSVPDGVLRINREAFLNCTNLLNIDLPRSVAFIGFDAFRGCSNLDNLYFLGNTPTLESGDPFSGVPEFTLHYLKRMTGWGATFVGRPTALLRSPVITSASNATARRGSSFTYQITASNNPTRFTAAPLPAGLSLNTNTGLISGTPTVITNIVVTLGAINLAGTNNRTLALNVLTNLATPPALGLPVLPVISSGTQIGGEIGAVFRYQAQASGIVTRFRLGGALPQGLTFQETNGLVGGMPLQSGNFPIPLWAMSGSNAGASVYLTIAVPPLAGPYTNRAFASSVMSNQPAWFAFDGNTNTAWHSLSSGFPHRIVYDLGSNTLVSSVLLHQGSPGLSNSYAKAVQVFASSNQINWLSLGTFQGLTNGRNALTLTNPVTQRFVALRATSGVSTTWAVREVSMGVFRPVLSNGIATKIGPSLRLTGAVQPNGLLTTARFEYGTNSNSLNGFAQVNLPDRNGTSLVGVTNLITNGLVPGKTYFYRLTASNADGTSVTPVGSVGF